MFKRVCYFLLFIPFLANSALAKDTAIFLPLRVQDSPILSNYDIQTALIQGLSQGFSISSFEEIQEDFSEFVAREECGENDCLYRFSKNKGFAYLLEFSITYEGTRILLSGRIKNAVNGNYIRSVLETCESCNLRSQIQFFEKQGKYLGFASNETREIDRFKGVSKSLNSFDGVSFD